MKPPVPGVEASRKLRGETIWAFPAVLMTWLSVTPRRRSFSGSTWTCSSRSRSPQIATFATPATPMRRGLTVHRAITDRSTLDNPSDETPIMSTRLEDESGWSIVGGRETFGRACAWVRRSATSWRDR